MPSIRRVEERASSSEGREGSGLVCCRALNPSTGALLWLCGSAQPCAPRSRAPARRGAARPRRGFPWSNLTGDLRCSGTVLHPPCGCRVTARVFLESTAVHSLCEMTEKPHPKSILRLILSVYSASEVLQSHAVNTLCAGSPGWLGVTHIAGSVPADEPVSQSQCLLQCAVTSSR